ncbi:MAG: ATP-binding cassette domain-containing protein [Oscillospiraceae bacterium]|jgi:ABC-2 type transport system ATP-binding protein|nr:ATP-binding cassette domain-containing protein [Oscillospiraceae bacterium]
MPLELTSLTKRFGQKVAVEDLNLTMASPGVYGLIGTNGAGKTTTIRMLLGMLPADEGTALWNGTPIPKSGLRYGYMPEERGIYMKTKVAEQLLYFARLRGMRKADAQAAVRQCLERLGVSEYANMQAEKLSKGNQQKIQLISTLLHDPELLILDEPFSGLDPLNTQLFRDLIQEMAAQGKYIILSSHQMSVVEEYCREITLMHRGKTILQGDLRKIKAGYGHTKLVLAAPEEAVQMAEGFGLRLCERRADETVFTLPAQGGDAQAEGFLRALLAANLLPVKFLLSEPTLHEIFIEKVGSAAGEGGAAA